MIKLSSKKDSNKVIDEQQSLKEADWSNFIGPVGKNSFPLPRTLQEQIILLSLSFSTTASVPFNDFIVTLLSEIKCLIQQKPPVVRLL